MSLIRKYIRELLIERERKAQLTLPGMYAVYSYDDDDPEKTKEAQKEKINTAFQSAMDTMEDDLSAKIVRRKKREETYTKIQVC